ncbi:MAG: hypothetical protein HYV19_04670 [Gemmatimonadetes bacterium]|nr:hypothetical protein [Gemmatimonadota bacterium]
MTSVHRLLTLGLLALSLPATARALPSWARRYNMNCSGCHSPAVPRLNATGIAFKWAGYRMPDDIGTAVAVKKAEEYLAARVIAAYDYVTRRGGETEADGFSVPSASLFAAGPLGKNYAAYLEFERESEGTVDLIGSLSSVWGRENLYGGFRVGQGHLLMASGGVAGFDRPTAISMPLAYAESLTDGIPLALGGDQSGAEAFLVLGGRNRTALQVLNGVVVGAGESGATVSRRDVVLTNQLMWDDAGSGIGVAAYFGRALGLVSDAPTESRRFYRLAVTANKIVNRVEVLGGYAFASDRDLPGSSGTLLETRSPTGDSYWLQGQYTTRRRPLTLFGRYEALNPDRDVASASRTRTVAGLVLPFSLPEYFRWSVELFRDTYRSAASPRRDGLATRLQVAF